MSENVTSHQSKSFRLREDWLVYLTGGLVSTSGGAIGWLTYRKFRTQSLDYKAIMTIAATLAGGIGIYLTGSALVHMLGKSDDEEVKPIASKQEESDSSAQDVYSLLEELVKEFMKLDRKLEDICRAKECKCLNNRIIMNKIPDRTEVSCKNEEMSKTLKDSNQKGPRRAIRNRIAKLREEIFSCISELKGYVQGTIDPLPSTRNIHFVTTEMSDEMRQQVVLIVKEYANSMLPKLNKVIDEFEDSVCKTVEVLNYDREQKINKVAETLRVMQKDFSKELNELNQDCNALQNETKKISLVPSGKKDHCENALENNMPPPESVTRSSLQEKDQGDWTLISKRGQRALPKLKIPTPSYTLLKSGDENEKTENSRSNLTARLILSEEQTNYLNLLKSEL